jgi:Na+/glutamate symporter
MNKNFSHSNRIEKILEENPFLILLESYVIIKNDKKRIRISLSQISNIRVVKNQDLTITILTCTFSALLYVLFLAPLNLHFAFQFLYFVILSFFIIISHSLKNYSYKLLINKGKFGFAEIAISKNNIRHAENFAVKFKKSINSKMNNKEFDYKKLKECL